MGALNVLKTSACLAEISNFSCEADRFQSAWRIESIFIKINTTCCHDLYVSRIVCTLWDIESHIRYLKANLTCNLWVGDQCK